MVEIGGGQTATPKQKNNQHPRVWGKSTATKLKVNIIQLNYKLFPAHLDVKANIFAQLQK